MGQEIGRNARIAIDFINRCLILLYILLQIATVGGEGKNGK
jgi:hypothetical protein